MTTILLAGGGTGGHVFPMLAVGDALAAIEPGTRVVYVGTARGIEARVVPEQGGELELLDILPLRGGGVSGFFKGVTHAAASIPAARDLVRKIKPQAVLSVGGYAGGPVSLAARTLGVPVGILEPNSVLGLSNRLLTPFAERAYTAFPETDRFFRPSIVRRFGVPLRKTFAPVPYEPVAGRLSILVLGGSQGAKALNETVPRAISRARDRAAHIDVVHQTGREREAGTRALYASLGVESIHAEVVPFIDDMAAALARADVVIARAGASTLAELCAVGRASILVPYPFAADDHQLKNARSLERRGAAIAIPQEEATDMRIAEEIGLLAMDHDRRALMAKNAAAIGVPDAARRVAEDLLGLAHAREERRGGNQ
ncbi:undecaprenyldiphospho-muramoylpentapeptide beta-N-acetylglucosaminyltransferase [Polyangium aurulentum]|uniref:undecaprenyldiphospho-muramoylpentapeptide beta-N-acetylglucosaminyltransferase n=1 Tax=Polyangium aurulentum TaxID=2567896 RepID=UPI0010AE18E6|nr:undecaprenyldiphospho-muramoylpentapeptide beta-N-acetylglucosaminyltransferase [Polyangium aurulentum]UQA60013.1 undecaprenyldiphospho-muramoylpentapeptide beta-N-acetylglucosaminyltransferase [Polyangium aurulentum]